ncbi:MAG TPA: YceD family protein [Pseudonocardiaceae bacterium]|nr:YceD family protein [Pseudonocardiaceae bacterium]
MMPRRTVSPRPDPSAPWVIDTRDLGRRPGAMRRYHRVVQLTAGLGMDVIGIPAGEQVVLDLRLESVMEGVLVSGTAVARITGQCARCLDLLTDRLELELTELFAYPDTATEATTDPDEVSRVVDGLLDLEPVVRDAVLLALPQAPLCSEDCPGLCAECGGKRVELGTDHRHEKIDPRWAALKPRLRGSEEENE